jgi:hypothetical protein
MLPPVEYGDHPMLKRFARLLLISIAIVAAGIPLSAAAAYIALALVGYWMGNENKATRAILIIVGLFAIAPLVIAGLVRIAVHELRCVYGFSKAGLKLLTRPFKAIR